MISIENRADAQKAYQGDWDENGTVSAHVPTEYAERFLHAQGYSSSRSGEWTAPDGIMRFADAQEALQVEIVGMAIQAAQG